MMMMMMMMMRIMVFVMLFFIFFTILDNSVIGLYVERGSCLETVILVMWSSQLMKRLLCGRQSLHIR